MEVKLNANIFMFSLAYGFQHIKGRLRSRVTVLIATSSQNRKKTKAYLVQPSVGSLFGVGWLVHFLEAVVEALQRNGKPSIIDYFLPKFHNLP